MDHDGNASPRRPGGVGFGKILFFVFLLVGLVLLVWAVLGQGRDRVLRKGSFHSVAHKGTGEALVLVRSDGSRVLQILHVQTYPGSELEVCIVAAPDAEDNETVLQGAAVCLGRFASKEAVMTFALPPQLDLDKYRAVTIWSPSYRVNFTTAPLE